MYGKSTSNLMGLAEIDSFTAPQPAAKSLNSTGGLAVISFSGKHIGRIKSEIKKFYILDSASKIHIFLSFSNEEESFFYFLINK